MNPGAGRGQHLLVPLRLESGEEVLFMVDTGAEITLLDNSLAPKLGEPLGQITVWRWGTKSESKLYAAPKLYLRGAPLKITGGGVADYDLKEASSAYGRPVLGILGIDCLENYCVQLDFAANRMRFLDSEHANKTDWGKAFPITDSGDGRPVIRENLAGVKDACSLIDTGFNTDGWLATNVFQQWTNQANPSAKGEVRCPTGVLGEETYPEMDLSEIGDSNGIGLSFLARHLVTFDFPNRTMYLKRTSEGPLKPECFEAARGCLQNLLNKGRLPGWSKDSSGEFVTAQCDPSLTCFIIKMRKNGDISNYYYEVVQAGKRSRWKLQKAWRTDESNRTIEQYPVL